MNAINISIKIVVLFRSTGDRKPPRSRGDHPHFQVLDRGREHLPATCRITGPERRRSSERHVSGTREA